MNFKVKHHYEVCHVFDDGDLQKTDVWAEDLEECKKVVRRQIALLGSKDAIISVMQVVAEVTCDEDVD